MKYCVVIGNPLEAHFAFDKNNNGVWTSVWERHDPAVFKSKKACEEFLKGRKSI